MPRIPQSKKSKRSRPKSARRAHRPAPTWPPGSNVGAKFDALVKLQSRLLAPDGCPWDREQTHASLRTYLVEETYEVLEALESGDPSKFADELGDLLLQIVFHAELARKAGRFAIGDVIERIHTKMVRRHPHVFGATRAKDSKAVLKNWEEMKREERRADTGEAKHSLLDGVSKTLPAVLEAYQLTRRAARIGFDWENLDGLLEKITEEAKELKAASAGSNAPRDAHTEEEVGDLLFVAVNVARFLSVDPEIALKKANRKFSTRFRWMEQEAQRRRAKLAETRREEMEKLWDAAKEQPWS